MPCSELGGDEETDEPAPREEIERQVVPERHEGEDHQRRYDRPARSP